MCGFAGFVSYGHVRADREERMRRLEAMGDAISHRGPDDAQYWDDGRLALVFRRLSIIDVAGGAQPFQHPARGLTLVANAEIYNHRALRAQLERNHVFRSRSDCEVALHGYASWGESFAEHLTGMFAIALWDARERRLVLARDRLGIKPLYLCRLQDGLLFGSELKALLAHPDCPRELDWHALDRGAISQSPSTSYVQGVELLPAGRLMTVTTEGAERCRAYWSIEQHLGSAQHGMDAARYTQAYVELLDEVTGDHLQRDVGAGLHLSGGLDSSLLAALVARKEAGFTCFSLVERTSHLGGDTDGARRLTERLGLPWHPVRVDHRSFADDLSFSLASFEKAIWMMDSPRFDLEWVLKEALHRTARQTVPGLKVVLLGQGADEFAGGYSHRLDTPHASWRQYLADEVEPNLGFDRSLTLGGGEELWPLLARPEPGSESVGPYHAMMALLCRQLQHHNLWHEDRSSSWQSLEARVPFLDHRLVELLASVPAPLHETLFWNKRIVRDAMARVLPGHEVAQPKIAFIDGVDTASRDAMLRQVVKRIFLPFRDKYLHTATCPFGAAKVEALATRVLERRSGFHKDMRLLIQCMAVTVFRDQCSSAAVRLRPRDRPVLPHIAQGELARLDIDLQAMPVSSIQWHAQDQVQLGEGLEIAGVVDPAANPCFAVLDGNTVVGRVAAPTAHPWLGRFLRNLGKAAAAHFTVQDWIDELDAAPPEFHSVLGMLYHQGVIRPSDGFSRESQPSPLLSPRLHRGPFDDEA